MLQKVKRILGIILLVAVLFTVFYVAYIKIADKAPSVFGYCLLRVSTDSMEPEIEPGEIILVKKTEPASLQRGDVITYDGEKGALKGKLVTSQISKEPYEKDGVYYFTTRGIKAGAVDDPEIDDSQIRGKVLYVIPLIGTVYDFFTEWYGILAFVVLIIVTFSSELLNLFRRLTQKKEADYDEKHTNMEDLRQSEYIEVAREKEFEGIITDLDEPDL